VVLNLLARLSAEPVHEEAVPPVHHDDGDEHHTHDAEGGYAREQSNGKAEWAEKLGSL